MSVKRFNGSNNVDISSVKRYDGANYIDCESAKRFDGSNWIDTWMNKQVFKPTSAYNDDALMKSIILVDEKNIRFGKYQHWRYRQIRFNCYDIPLKRGDVVEATVGQFANGSPSSSRRYVQFESGDIDSYKFRWGYDGMYTYKYSVQNSSATHMVISVTIDGGGDYTIELTNLSIRLGTIYVNGKKYNPVFKL